MNPSLKQPKPKKMGFFSKRIKIITTIILFIAFILHLSVLIISKLNPDTPEVKYYKKDLKDIDFPIAFQICIEDKNKSRMRYRELGYSDLYNFFNGQSKFNKSIVGWAGHTENGSSIGTVEGLMIKYLIRSVR